LYLYKNHNRDHNTHSHNDIAVTCW